jgi:hypothetical protein
MYIYILLQLCKVTRKTNHITLSYSQPVGKQHIRHVCFIVVYTSNSSNVEVVRITSKNYTLTTSTFDGIFTVSIF